MDMISVFTVKKPVLVIGSILMATVVEFFLVSVTPFLRITFPVVILVTCWWWLSVSIGARLWLAGVVGFFLDSATLLPFGTHMVALLVGASLMGFIRRFFSPQDMRIVTTGIDTAIGVMIVFAVMLPAGFLLGYVTGTELQWNFLVLQSLFFSATLWTMLLCAGVWGISRLSKSF